MQAMKNLYVRPIILFPHGTKKPHTTLDEGAL